MVVATRLFFIEKAHTEVEDAATDVLQKQL
jgi:hypothetical protein